MKRFQQLFFLSVLLATTFFSCAQQKSMVKKLTAYTMQKLPGTVRKDEHDREIPVQPVTLLQVYAETSTNDIQWDSAWFQSKAYKIVPQLLKDGLFEAGIEKETDKKIIITADAGLFLYQLQLQPVEENGIIPGEYEEGKILLKGKRKGKVFYAKSDAPVEMRSFDAM